MSSGVSNVQTVSGKHESKSPDSNLLAKSSSCVLSDHLTAGLTGTNYASNDQKNERGGPSAFSDDSQAPRFNLDDVINAISVRGESKEGSTPFQGTDRYAEDPPGAGQSPDAQNETMRNAPRGFPDNHQRIYKELPIIPLSDFKHPDFPTDEMLHQPRPTRPIPYFAVINVSAMIMLTVGFTIFLLTYRNLSDVDPSSKVYIKPLPPWNAPIQIK